MDNTRNIGSAYETLAEQFLLDQGHLIKDKNFRLKDSEIDIISLEPQEDNIFGIKEYLVFTEVKFRKDSLHGDPFEAVNCLKQKKIISCAKYYLYSHKYPVDFPVRFDVISICGDSINWIKNAFY